MTWRGPLTLSKQTGSALIGHERSILRLDEALGGKGVRAYATSPSGRKRELEIAWKEGSYSTDFQPNEMGDWNFSVVNVDGSHVEGSPFSIRVHDPNGVKVTDLVDGVVGEPCHFNVDTSRAGQGTAHLRVFHQGSPVDSELLPLGGGGGGSKIHRAKFTPDLPGVYSVQVLFQGSHVAGSPFTFVGVDPKNITVKVMGLEVLKVNEQTSFEVVFDGKEVVEADADKLVVRITSPGNRESPSKVSVYSTMSFLVEFVPTVAGRHEISVLYCGRNVSGSPFHSEVFDPSKIIIHSSIGDASPGESMDFEVDCSQAGNGKLEAKIDSNVSILDLVDLGSGLYKVTLVPMEERVVTIFLSFNGEDIPGSPIRIPVGQKVKVTHGDLAVDKTALVTLPAAGGPPARNVSARVKAPSGRITTVPATQERSGSYQVEFQPKEVGEHEITVLGDGKPIPGRKYYINVFDPASIVISPTNQIGTLGEPLTVVVDSSKAGKGRIDVEVLKESGDVEKKVTEVGQGMHQVTFTPLDTQPHEVRVTINGMSGNKCKLVVPVIDRSLFRLLGEGISYAAIGQPSTFKVIGSKVGRGTISVDITSMEDGSGVPTKVTSSTNDDGGTTYDVTYMTRKIGDYKAEVRYDGVVIGEGPFVIKSFDLGRVRLEGLTDVVKGVESEFVVDASEAGEGNMVIAIESAGDRNLKVPSRVDVGASVFRVRFAATRVGPHNVNVLFNDRPISGNPFPFSVLDPSCITIRSSTSVDSLVQANRNFNIRLEAPNCDPKDFKVTVSGPNREVIQARLTKSANDDVEINFIPKAAGDYEVDLEYKGLRVPGFPISYKIWDINQVKVGEIKPGQVGMETSFSVDAGRAGPGRLEVSATSPSGEVVPVATGSLAPGRYMATFTPKRAGRHELRVVFNGENVRGSPFIHPVIDKSKVKVSGQGLGRIAANKRTSFEVSLGDLGVKPLDQKDLSVKIYDPLGNVVTHRLQRDGVHSDSFKVEFTPDRPGRHRVEVKCHDVDLGSFAPDVFDPREVRMDAEVPEFVLVSQPISFNVNSSRAGDGDLKVKVESPSSSGLAKLTRIPSGPDGVRRATFVPKEAGVHRVSVLYEGELVTESPFVCNVVDPKSIVPRWASIETVPINKTATLDIESDQYLPGHLFSASVIDPSGDTLPISLSTKGPSGRRVGGGATLEFFPIAVGRHRVELSAFGAPAPGSPFASEAYDPTDVRVAGLDAGVVSLGRPVEFFVTKSGPGEIRAKVKSLGGKQTPVAVAARQVAPNVTRYTFTPVNKTDYLVDLTFDDEPIPGFPKVLKLEGLDSLDGPPTEATRAPPVEASSQYEISRRETTSATQTSSKVDYSKAKVIITGPNGETVAGQLIRQPTGDYKIDYKSPYVGRHKVEVVLDGEHLMDTPFFVDLHDASKVDVISARQRWHVDEPVDFEVVTKNAGDAPLGIKLLEPDGTPLAPRFLPTGEGQRVVYTPRSAGPHRAFVTFGGNPVPGGNPLVQEAIKPTQAAAHGSGLTRGVKDEPSRFFVDGKNQKGDLTVQVDGPNSVAKVNIESVQNGAYNVTYIPVEVGHFDVSVRWNGKNIPGSPFTPKIVDPTKVKVVGVGIVDPATKVVQLRLEEVNKIELDTKMAGPGQLTSEVTDLRKRANVPVDVVRMDEERYVVAFVPTEKGNYLIRILWDDHLIPSCPMTGCATGGPSLSSADQTATQGRGGDGNPSPSKVTVSGRGLKEATIGQQAEFIIDGTNGGPGKPKVKLVGLGTEIPVQMETINKNFYRCFFVPRMPGDHLLSIDWSDRPVPGSPFHVMASEASDASKVVCSGDGLRKGILGKDIRASIDTRRAGQGTLGVQCTGPTTVANTSILDLQDGLFTLFIKPLELGKHLLEIKYAGKHVPGSPFPLKISPPPDPSKVAVYGPGVRHGLLAEFQSHFFVDTMGAGAGQLTVRVKGPKGAFCVDMQRDDQRDRLITCRYDPSEKGEYIIQVKWSDEDVPGSPFPVRIVDTKEELDEALLAVPTPAEVPPPGLPRPSNPRPRWERDPDIGNRSLDGIRRTGKDTFVGRRGDPFYEAAKNSKPVFRQFDGLGRIKPPPSETYQVPHITQRSLFQPGSANNVTKK